MELQLICHGMMLFWYREAEPGRPDGYSILIPQSPPGEHEVRLGVGPGAPQTVIGYGTQPEGTQHFDLMVGNRISQKPRGKKPKETNLLLYRSAAATAVPNIRDDASAGVAFRIEIPYPSREEAVRATTYAANPYLEGAVVQAFDIRPRRILSATAFTFEVDEGARYVYLQNRKNPEDKRVILDSPITATTKLHLYCQSATDPSSDPGHLEMFNNLLLFNGAPLDLQTNPERMRDIDPAGVTIPQGLAFKDMLSLGELFTIYPEGSGGSSRDQTGVKAMGIDPADCGQGGGC